MAGAIAFAVFFKGGKQEEPQQSKPERVKVTVRKVSPQVINTQVHLTGRLIPEDKIDLYAEVGGIFLDRGKAFKVGNEFRKGEVLVMIESEEFRQRLRSDKSAFVNSLAQVVPDLKIDYPENYIPWRDYLLNFDPDEPLPALPEVDSEQLKLFLTGRNIYTQYYSLKEAETQLDDFLIRAPYDGIVTEAAINNGTLVRVGQQLGEFIKKDAFELEAAVSPMEIEYLNIGDSVALSPVKTNKPYYGRVVRINGKIDTETQTIKVFVQVRGSDLRAGMYMEGAVQAETVENALSIDRSLLMQDDQVYTVEDSTAVATGVQVHKYTGDKAIVTGLSTGVLLITQQQSAAFEGQLVTYEMAAK